jgi:hypothetical protein
VGIPQHFAEEILKTYWILFGSCQATKDAYLSLPAPKHLRRLLPDDNPSHSLSVFNLQSWRPYDIPLHLCETGDYDRETFNAFDFPYFAQRFLILKHYLTCRRPRTLMSLWKDKRDITQWYTLWVVTIIGSFTLFISILSLVCSILQTVVAFRPFQHS